MAVGESIGKGRDVVVVPPPAGGGVLYEPVENIGQADGEWITSRVSGCVAKNADQLCVGGADYHGCKHCRQRGYGGELLSRWAHHRGMSLPMVGGVDRVDN